MKAAELQHIQETRQRQRQRQQDLRRAARQTARRLYPAFTVNDNAHVHVMEDGSAFIEMTILIPKEEIEKELEHS